MNIKYNFLVSSGYDKLITREFITDCLSYESLTTYLYNNFRNFNKLYADIVNTTNIDKYVLNNIIELFSKGAVNNIDAEYFVYISIDNDIANIRIINKKYNCIYAFKEVVINDKYPGNCVTDFVNRGLQPITLEITKYYEDINNRHINRMQEPAYHNSWTYEKDYAQIVKIKKLAEKLTNICERELQQLSDKYTK